MRATLVASSGSLGVALNDAQIDRLLRFVELLGRWNATYNLTAVRDSAQMLVHHVVDCLACVPPLRRETSDRDAVKLLDVGSGGGLPGAVVAIACPDIDVTCIDTVGKKVAFVSQVAATLRLGNLRALHGRVENQPAAHFDVVASRAFASLDKFTSLTSRQLASDGKWMAMKGHRPDDEIANVAPNVNVFHVERLDVPDLNAQRCLVWMRPATTACAH